MTTAAAPTLSAQSTQPLEPHVVDLLCEVAIAEGFTDCTLTASAGANHGDGFLSSVVRVLITGDRPGHPLPPSALSVIVKVPPADERRRTEFGSAQSFRSEAHFYSRLATAFAAFQLERGVPAGQRLQTPRLLASRCDDQLQQYAIVLEDLRFSGWVLRDKFAAVDEAHARCVAEGLARYHAVSLALRDQQPQVFAEFAAMENSFLQHVEEQPAETCAFFGLAWRRALAALGDDERDVRVKRRFEAAASDFVAIVGRSLRSAPNEPRRVIGHGDFWNNNMMFEYDAEHRPQRICLFDFQNAKLHSPVLDVISYLLLSTDRAFRAAHMAGFLRHYHAELGAAVRRLGSDPEALLSWRDFEADVRRFGGFIALTAPFMLQVTTAAADDVRRNEERLAGGEADTNLFYCESTTALYEERVRDVLRLAEELGFFEGYE